jgi:RNA polymerase sigma factor (sigma-70 family)
MAAYPDHLLRHVRRIVSSPDADSITDAALLGRFVRDRDEDAFAALVTRHGPMVVGVCRRVLHDAHLAEDAFQATFMVLARKAAAVHPADRLASWLHGVARQVSLRLLRGESRRHRREAQSTQGNRGTVPGQPLDELSARELLLIFDEELQRLPAAYRLPLTLCSLEGLTQEEAARQLGWSAGSVKGRLERGRAQLHIRLARRGLTLAGALAAVEVSCGSAAAVPAAATVRAALAFVAGRGQPGRITLLAQGVLRGMALSRWKVAAALVLLGVGLVAVGMLARPQPTAPATAPQEAPAAGAEARVDGDGEPLPSGALLRLGSLRLRHRATLRSVAFTPDGKFLASGGWGRVISFWDPATGKEIRRIETPEKGVDAIAFSRDGKLLAGTGLNGPVILWDAATGKEIRRLEGHRQLVKGIAFSPKGDRLIAGDAEAARLWDVATGKVLHVLPIGQGNVSAVAYSPDGRFVAAAGENATTFVWDAKTGRQFHRLRGEGTYVYALAFAPDSASLLVGVENGSAAVWDLRTGKPGRPLPGKLRSLQTLAFSADGKLLATGDGQRQLRLWDLATRTERWHVTAHPDRVNSVSFSPDGRTIASGSAESSIHLWDVATGKPLVPTAGHQERLTAVAYSRDGRTIFTGAWDRTVRMWDAATGKELKTLMAGTEKEEEPFRTATVGQLAVAPDGKLLAVMRADETLQLWELPSGKEWNRFQAACITFSPDGKLFACGGRGTEGTHFNVGVIRLYERATGKLVRELRGHKTPVSAVVFSTDGRTVFSRGVVFFGMRTGEIGESETEFLRAWDVASGRQRRVIPPPSAALITSLALSPDGRTLATFSDLGKTALLIEAATGGKRAELHGHADMLFQTAFSPDGRTLATAGMDGVIRLWDAWSGKELGRLQGHRGWVLGVAFSPDGRRLVSGSGDTTALIWDVARYTQRGSTRARLSADEVRSAWEDLAGEAGKAYHAIGALAAAPEQAVPFLAERLKPAVAPDLKRVEGLLAQLDSKRFADREAATRELENLGGLAEPAARRALADKPQLEVKRRLEALLEKMDAVAPSPGEVRAVRAVEALEHAGTPAARRLLADLAAGVPEARQTREARAALGRLAGSSGK